MRVAFVPRSAEIKPFVLEICSFIPFSPSLLRHLRGSAEAWQSHSGNLSLSPSLSLSLSLSPSLPLSLSLSLSPVLALSLSLSPSLPHSLSLSVSPYYIAFQRLLVSIQNSSY
jgi:hypothetical protein